MNEVLKYLSNAKLFCPLKIMENRWAGKTSANKHILDVGKYSIQWKGGLGREPGRKVN